jgi:predicted MPP superfamily phosphohydrolase
MNNKILILILYYFASNANAQTVTDIYTVQQDTTLIGREVAVVGVVTASTGIFGLNRTYVEDQNGGTWSGIAVWDINGDFYAEQGDWVRIIGIVSETNGLTEIIVNAFNIFSSNVPFPAIVNLSTSDIATGSLTVEPYESVLIQVNNVTIINDSLGDGEWLVDDGSGACRIDDEANNFLYQVPQIGTEISSITGILNYSNNNFKIEPRYRSDIANGDTSSIYTISQIQQNSTLLGDTVTVSGIVTAATGVFHPGKTFIEEPDGGPFSGILLVDSTASLSADEGDELLITGVVFENEGMTEILVHSFDIFSTGNPLPAVEIVNTGDISSDSDNAELYEGVLVGVNDIYVSDNNLGNGEWEVNDIEGACLGKRELCRIDDEAEGLSFDVPQNGVPLSSITGILVYNNNNFKLEPRYRSDINETDFVPIGDTLTIIQRPLMNIPSISQPGDTLEIICDLSESPGSWSAFLIKEEQEIGLTPVGEEFDDDKNLWTLKVFLPVELISELYDLKLKIPGEDTDISGNSVQIIPHFKDDFYFIHITDTHIPTHLYCRDEGYEQDSTEFEGLRAVIEDINLINPAFVLHTGDLINEGELEDYLYNRYYTKAKRVLSEFEVPLYLVPGNHDLGGWSDTPMSDGTARRDWWRFFGWKHLNNPSGINPQYTQDYSFRYGNCHLIGLEAYINYDRWRSDTYGGESFISQQLDWLQQDLNDVDDSLLKILFYHFDFNGDLNLGELGVDLALWGHTHGNSYTPGEYPISISTEACSDGRRAYRLIRVKGDSILPSPTLHAGDAGENLSVIYLPANNGLNYQVSAEVTNNLDEHFEHTQLRFSMPKDGKDPQITGGNLIQIDDSGLNAIYYIGVDVNESSTQTVTVSVYSPSSGPFAEHCIIDDRYITPGLDTLNITAGIVNPDSQNIKVTSIIESTDLSVVDTVALFDDGSHGDSTSGDGLFSGYWPAGTEEKEFNVHINTVTLDSVYNNLLPDASLFTTIGPIKYDSLYIAQQIGELFRIRLLLRNGGSQTTARNINAQLTLSDPTIKIEENYRPFGDIGPGQTVQSSSFYNFITQNPPDSIHGIIEVFSDDRFFWSDSFSLGFVATGISETNNEIPLKFALKQNYPNPFNPSTTIEFSLPKAEFVTLKIYDLIGQEVTTLLAEQMLPGNYKYVWDASAYASGMYYYKLQTSGGFVQSLKLILVK